MQQSKDIKNNSELEIIGTDSEKLTSSLTNVIEKFQLKRHLAIFDVLKSKGLAISSLLSILVILPFYGIASVYQLMRIGLKDCDFSGKKQVYYDAKNNEFIDWRKLLMYHAKRFIYLVNHNVNLKSNKTTALIFDDTLLPKTGKKIERVSIVHDHTSDTFILGYKLLVCGFWDGDSFIPIDFSLHRERGRKQKKLLNTYQKAVKVVDKQKQVLLSLIKTQQEKQEKYLNHKNRYEQNPTKTHQRKLSLSTQQYENINEKLKQAQEEMSCKEAEKSKAYNALKRFYNNEKLFGLSKKERQSQFKKAVSTKSHGFKRRKENDKSKTNIMLDMLDRAVAKGIIPDYVLIDSWFFCYELLYKLQRIKKGGIKLVAMIKLNNQIFKLCSNNKQMSVKNILNTNERNAKRCKKLKAQYIKVPCFYKNIRINLFFVRMGKCKTWRLMSTTDLSLSFIELMEVYQIRWSIEVFFKDSKQYLNLSNCQSNTFDAQIADITISMMQYIMLSYFKRLNYQQTIGGLFENLAKELEELDLISRLLKLFWALIETVCEICGIDFFELHQNIIKNNEIMKIITKLLPQQEFRKVA